MSTTFSDDKVPLPTGPRLRKLHVYDHHETQMTSTDTIIILVGPYYLERKEFIDAYAEAPLSRLEGVDDIEIFVGEFPLIADKDKPCTKKKRLLLVNTPSLGKPIDLGNAETCGRRESTPAEAIVKDWILKQAQVPTAVIYVFNLASDIIDEDSLPCLLSVLSEIPSGTSKTTFLRTGWREGDRGGTGIDSERVREFNATFGDLIREGAEYMNLKEGTSENDIIRYIVRTHHIQNQEEMIGRMVLAPTEAGKVYKSTLEMLVADAFDTPESSKPTTRFGEPEEEFNLKLIFYTALITVVLVSLSAVTRNHTV
ncbi:hypothetical protein FA15DRAFT_665344 [Coprinopsis marcescibilis]|uniref:Uncharacterized protein n=1 Tax=Coprinopsis marcescibilis TaxID=230819 RepID=A0A5C3L757_COPMA|nr:hypothetical protein FA15DRAFT_665344 [Coprinopsis marcescibilis]